MLILILTFIISNIVFCQSKRVLFSSETLAQERENAQENRETEFIEILGFCYMKTGIPHQI